MRPRAPELPSIPNALTPDPAAVAASLTDLQDVLASQRLERLEPSPTVIAQLERVLHGKLTIAVVLADIHAHIAYGEL
jgi:hypothetical protein